MERVTQLFQALERGAGSFRCGDEDCDVNEMAARARRYAAQLQLMGVAPGDRIAVIADPSIELIIANIGHYYAGAVHVPINTRYRGQEIAHILEDSGARAVVVDVEGADLLADVAVAKGMMRVGIDGADGDLRVAATDMNARLERPELRDESPAMLIYTSGTTGKSKGVELSYRAVVANIDELTTAWGWSAEDTLVSMLPLFHVHGLCIGVHGAILRGLRVFLYRKFSAEALVHDVEHRSASVFMGVPTMYRFLLEYLDNEPARAAALASARLFTSGSAPLPARAFARFRSLTGHDILERYGMSETLITLSNPLVGERRPGTVGMPVPGGEVRIRDEYGRDCEPGERGEIQVRGGGLMTGYWGNPEATAREFDGEWFRTGDVALRDEDGYVHIVGRRSVDIIKSGGFKIAAREIEDVLAQHEDITEVAVYGVPDEIWGQRIVAAVVLTSSSTVVSNADWLATLAGFVAARLADYKKPRQLLVLDELPRNALGKLQKHRLIARSSD